MKKPIKIFKSQYGYSMQISQKLKDGTYENEFLQVQFKKDVELEHKTLIIPLEWDISFYTNKDGNKVYKLCVWEFTIHTDIQQAKPSEEPVKEEDDPFQSFGDSVSIDDNFLD